MMRLVADVQSGMRRPRFNTPCDQTITVKTSGTKILEHEFFQTK